MQRKPASWHSHNCFPPVCLWDVFDGKMVKDKNGAIYNQQETCFILQILTKFFQISGPTKIGIIAFYKKQVFLIRNAIEHSNIRPEFKNCIAVSTVDGFQG